jgi:hypothetical protein
VERAVPDRPGSRAQVNIGLRVLTRPNQEKLPEIYRTLGLDYAERVLPSIIQVGWRTAAATARRRPGGATGFRMMRAQPSDSQETLKSVVAQYNASQLLTMREVGPPCLAPASGPALVARTGRWPLRGSGGALSPRDCAALGRPAIAHSLSS